MPKPRRGEASRLAGLECRTPKWTPDGKSIVFAGKSDAGARIYAVDVGDLSLRALTDGPEDITPSVLADDRVAFARKDADGHNIYVVGADGGEPTRVTAGPSRDVSPSWEADGRRIAYVSDAEGADDIWVAPADATGNPRRVTTDESSDITPACSPSDDRIAFASDRDGPYGIYAATAANVERLAPGHARDPAWSPDGNTIAFAGTVEAQSSRGPLPGSICLLDLGSGDVTQIPEAAMAHSPDWSPDGKQIVFTRNFRLYILDVASRELRPVDGEV